MPHSSAYDVGDTSIICANCGNRSTGNVRVDVEINRRLGTCVTCFPTMSTWGAVCTHCDAPRCWHDGPDKNLCPRLVVAAEALPPRGQLTALPPALPPIDAEIVELP